MPRIQSFVRTRDDARAVLPVAEVAQMLAVPVSRVHQMVRDGQLLQNRRGGFVPDPAPGSTTPGRPPILESGNSDCRPAPHSIARPAVQAAASPRQTVPRVAPGEPGRGGLIAPTPEMRRA